MSLTSLIKRPDIRAAFDSFATTTRTPDHMRGCQLLVPDAKGPRGLAGTAFDYLARAQITRDFNSPNIRIFTEQGTLARVEDHIGMVPIPNSYEEYLRRSIEAAKHELADYAAGRGDLRRLTNHIQDVAWVELAFRSNQVPDAEFRPVSAVSDELLRMIELFNPMRRYAPRDVCLLNPIFVVSKYIGGADADLVIDQTLIDLKTTIKPYVEVDMLRQLAGYAVLQSIGGIKLDAGIHDIPFQSVELYFARYGKTATWTLAELFPGDGFERFRSVIREIVDASKKQFDEMMERIERRQAEEDAQKKLIRAKKRKKSKAKKAKIEKRARASGRQR